MKNVKQLTAEMCEVFELTKSGKMSPTQSIAVSRSAEALLKSVRTEIIAAEHRGDVVFPEFLKV